MDSINALQALKTARAEFEKLVSEIRPELHRYCTRMTGSVVDGEDVVQDTLAKAFYLLPQMPEIANLRSWIFRIAHNKAIDYTRHYTRRFGEPLDEHPDIAADSPPVESQELTKMRLALFMKLTPAQRGHLKRCAGSLSDRDCDDLGHECSVDQRRSESGAHFPPQARSKRRRERAAARPFRGEPAGKLRQALCCPRLR